MRPREFVPILALVLGAAPLLAMSDEEMFQAREKMDSLQRETEKRIFPVAEQKTWRQCIRGKREFLEKGRKSDPAFAENDTLVRKAKLSRVSPEDPEVRKLMERKFLLEKSLEDRYQATPDGGRCREVEDGRRKKLQAALGADPEYLKWKRRAEPAENGSDAI